LESQPPDEDRRRIADLCGLNADEILAARDARPAPTPLIDDRLAGALRLASDDARRLQQGVVSAEHLMFGLLRAGFPAMEAFQAWSGLDAERFAADVKDRVLGKEDVLAGETLPLDADAQAFLDTATSIATEHRRETVRTNHLLLALTQQSASVAVRTFERYGGNVSKVNEFLLRMR
ncbi:MAG TPA: Clp protease N-terminal domain-containing protein, partial [Gemmatimonas sp.]|nr:Clp protease N-terminal domain-containing protein [Gemmatimonas sp.]